jgi:hypothetical protein
LVEFGAHKKVRFSYHNIMCVRLSSIYNFCVMPCVERNIIMC